MVYKNIILQQENNILTITFNRPDKLNPVSNQLLTELRDVTEELSHDSAIKFVIITGSGRAFSAGADVVEQLAFLSKGPDAFRLSQRRRCRVAGDFLHSFETLEQVTIAAINGLALGAGLALALVCDFRIASQEAVISIPEAHMGTFFAFGFTPRLVRLVGPAKAKELIMTGDSLSASEALQCGLLNKVVAPADLMPACQELIKKIASHAPLAIRMTKMIISAVSTPLGNVESYEPDLVDIISMSRDRTEALQAFSEHKRQPRFTGE